MTPMQFVTEECANHQHDGSCLGMVINDDLTITHGKRLPRCLVADNQRCPYFEECVLPMADMVSDPRRATALQSAVALYRQVTKQGEDLTRQCPECGGPMAKGKQYCPKCADARRKASNRAAQERHRRSEGLLSAEVQKTDPKTPMKQGGILAVSRNAIGDSHPPQNDQTSADIVAGRAS